MNWINTWPFGWGVEIKSWIGSDGVKRRLVQFPGFREVVKPCQLAGSKEHFGFAMFSNN